METFDELHDKNTQSRGEAFVRTVLDITLTELAQQGFARLTIPHIAQMAGVNKTSIYRRWPSKSELVQDALAAAMRHTDDAPDTGALRGDLIGLARTVAIFMRSPLGSAVIRVMLAEGGNPEVRALAAMTYGSAGRNAPQAVMMRAMQRGEIKEGADPSVVLFTIAGAILHRVFVEQKDASDDWMAQVVDLVLLGAGVRR